MAASFKGPTLPTTVTETLPAASASVLSRGLHCNSSHLSFLSVLAAFVTVENFGNISRILTDSVLHRELESIHVIYSSTMLEYYRVQTKGHIQ